MIKLIKNTFYKEKETKMAVIQFIAQAEKLSFGKECDEFERKFAKWQGRKYCVFVNSGSSANLALIQALLNMGKLKRGDKIGFSAVTWSTNVMPLIQLGLEPIPVDIELDTLNVSSRRLKEILKKNNLKILFLTNLLGFCDDIDEIKRLCSAKKILFLEDNCESLGSVFKEVKLGNFGFASTFSFYVGHHMSTIEGGAVCTDDEKLATMLRIVRAHGWDRNLDRIRQTELRTRNKINSTFYSRYTFYDLGFNLRPTEINGFIGNKQLGFLDEIVEKREKNFYYLAPPIFELKERFYPLRFNHLGTVSNFAIPVICKTRKIKEELVRRCNGKIEIRPVVGGNISDQPFFRKYIRKVYLKTPNAKLVHDNGLYFGNNPELSKKEMELILRIFTKK